MIFNLWPRVVVKIGPDERHVFDRADLMFTEVQEIERVTKLSYGEWEGELGRYSITAVAALVHVLRKRDSMASDFATMQFAVRDLDVVPLHDDDTEYTAEEATAELTRRMKKATDGPGPTLAAAALAAAPAASSPTPAPATRDPSPRSSISAPGNGSSSRTRTSSAARRT